MSKILRYIPDGGKGVIVQTVRSPLLEKQRRKWLWSTASQNKEDELVKVLQAMKEWFARK